MYTLFTVGTLLWLLFGIFTTNFPIIIANAITFLFASTILYYKIKF
jgi:MtN3 and saliva related transmembrane protein